MAATSVTKNITEHKSVLNVLENRLLHIEHFDLSVINVQTNQWGKHSIEIAAIWAGSLCGYFTFHTNSQSCCSNLLFKSNQSHYSNISHTTYNPETSYIRIIYYTNGLTVFSWYDGWAFQSPGFDRRSQQDCLSRASSHDCGPWRERRQMRLEASDRNPGEFVGHREKPVADDAQCGLLPQTNPPRLLWQHYSGAFLSLCNQVKELQESLYYLLKKRLYRICSKYNNSGRFYRYNEMWFVFFISYTLRIKWLPLKTNHRKGFLLYKKSMH